MDPVCGRPTLFMVVKKAPDLTALKAARAEERRRAKHVRKISVASRRRIGLRDWKSRRKSRSPSFAVPFFRDWSAQTPLATQEGHGRVKGGDVQGAEARCTSVLQRKWPKEASRGTFRLSRQLVALRQSLLVGTSSRAVCGPLVLHSGPNAGASKWLTAAVWEMLKWPRRRGVGL